MNHVFRLSALLATVLIAGAVAAHPAAAAPPPPTIHGVVWDDRNHNGIREDGEPGIPGIVLWYSGSFVPLKRIEEMQRKVRALKPGQPAPHFDPDVGQVITDANGAYRVEPRMGWDAIYVMGTTSDESSFWRFSPVGAGSDRTKDSDFPESFSADTSPPIYYSGVPLHLDWDSGEPIDLQLDAGLYSIPAPKKDAVISGVAWNDRNRNGVRDEGEPGIPGLPLTMHALEGPITWPLRGKGRTLTEADTVTDANGHYEFPGLYGAKTYVGVRSGPLDGEPEWTFTSKGAGDDPRRDSDVEPYQWDPTWAYSTPEQIPASGHVVIDAGLFRDEPSPAPSTPAPTQPAPTQPAPTPSPGGGGGGSLPTTGSSPKPLAAAGALLLLAGVGAVVLARRRRRA